jgi:hypothetical protein
MVARQPLIPMSLLRIDESSQDRASDGLGFENPGGPLRAQRLSRAVGGAGWHDQDRAARDADQTG